MNDTPLSHDQNSLLPEKASGEFAYNVMMGTLGVIPGIGTFLQALAPQIVESPLATRQREWFNQLYHDIKRLREKEGKLDVSDVVSNPEFVTAVIETTPLAIKTHLEFKRKLFENVVLNAACGISIEEAARGKFMALLDQFSEAHIRLLKILHDPLAFPKIVSSIENTYMGSIDGVISQEVSDQGISADVMDIVVADLVANQLISGNLKALTSKQGLGNSWTTELGRRFLLFVSRPVSSD